jgi:signal transduction histidine kinase
MPAVLHLGANPSLSEGVDFQRLFDSLPDPAVYVAPDHRIAACNRTFRERFPIVIERQFLEPLQSILDDDEELFALPLVPPKRQSIAGGRAWRGLRPSVTKLPSGGALVVLRPMNVTELEQRQEIERLRQELRQAQEKANAALGTASALAKNFANVSHELRTPLNAVVGFSDMMRQQVLGPLGDDRYQRYADIIHGSGLHLLDLVNDILDFAKLDAGKLELCREDVEILGVIVSSMRELELQAAKSRVGFCVHVRDGISVMAGDPRRLRQILANLLSNAIKFTPERGEVSVDVYRRGKNIAIAVSDTGIGMSAADIPVALEPFGRLAAGGQFNSTGTGLGLPLTKRLAELHGGTIEVDSAPGFGTTVTVLLPERKADLAGEQTCLAQAESLDRHYLPAAN